MWQSCFNEMKKVKRGGNSKENVMDVVVSQSINSIISKKILSFIENAHICLLCENQV